ncbi:MAG: hypothetical protein COV59_04875 [Candidatus Magasanikbacteria bacterium CG11_big_fil_rev_8_21_14_0_20_39_34]|uniref:Glycosyl transferase family 1 domain-containing protein n=1 Tax=Candidatus Magasanikbacteria bacterium CG11_big_fil_rev_8_21_14_0_20_39_34 TaxID=1974653 RepID=A0A2H0N3L9_9BACT|nr:MAG: hypothetical protein COV59_04875 [Candidatus Magasanikbacteria bacterium CG11_big_fil_rev_8_21_14_0_20_39_34]
MNIGIDIRSLFSEHKTGVGEFTSEFLENLFAADKENQYFLFYGSWKKDPSWREPWKQKNVHYICISWPSKLVNILSLLRIKKIDSFFKEQLDWFISPNIGFATVSRRCKHLLVVHDLSFALHPQWYSWKRRFWHFIISPKRQCRRADIIIAPSENTKRDIIHRYQIQPEKVQRIYPGLSKTFLDDTTQITPEKIHEVKQKYTLPSRFLLFLGTIEPRKNIESAITAFTKWNKKQKEAYILVIAGPLGWKYKKIIKKIDSHSDVVYIGYVDAQDKAALYKLARVFIYPSFYEGLGFPILEAQSVGTPVVTSNNSSLVEVAFQDTYLAHPLDSNELEKGIAFQFTKEKADNEKKFVHFSWTSFVKEFLDSVSANKYRK